MPCFCELREIFPRQQRERGEHRNNVGEELRRGECKENENEERPYDEIEKDRIRLPCPKAPKDAGQCPCPWIETGNQDDEVKPVVVLSGMFRADEARHIVIAEEGVDEGISMDHAHRQVPGKSHKAGKRDAPCPAKRHDIFESERSREDHPQPHDERWKSEADRALRKERETAEDIGRDIFFSKERDEGDGERESQRLIRHRASGKDDDFQRRRTDEGTVERGLLTHELSHRQVEVGRKKRTHQDRRKTGARGRDSEESEGDRF